MTEYLTKEEELELGFIIQRGLKAEEELASIKEDGNESEKQQQILELQKDIEKGHDASIVLVENNKNLVYDIANKFKRRYPAGPHIDDVVGDGMVGLWTAVKKYDPTRGHKFSTMAFNWIGQSITRGSNKTSRLVRLPENRISDFIHITRTVREIENEDENVKDVDSVVKKKLGLNDKEYSNIMNAAMTHASLNKVVGSEENGAELHNYIDNHSPSAELDLFKQDSMGTLYEAIDKLSEIEREVLYASCKMNPEGGKPKTAKAVKEDRELSSTQYRNILNEAVGKIRKSILTKGFEYSDYEMIF